MDAVYPLLVVGTAERHIQLFNLTNPTTVHRVSPYYACTVMRTEPCSVDTSIAAEMADTSRFLLPLCYWVCGRVNRRASGDSARRGERFEVNLRCQVRLPTILTKDYRSQSKLLFQMSSSRSTFRSQRQHTSLCCQSHLFPPTARDILHRRR